MKYNQNDECLYIEECINKENNLKCNRCTNNPFNFEKIDQIGEGFVHDRKNKNYFNYVDNYEPK